MNIEYTVTYPSNSHDKQRRFTTSMLPHRTERDTLEGIFAGWNYGSGDEFTFFLHQNCRSMSVGDVVALYKPDKIGSEWFICNPCGWLKVNATQAQSWLDFPREYGCSSFELRKWKISHMAENFRQNRP